MRRVSALAGPGAFLACSSADADGSERAPVMPGGGLGGATGTTVWGAWPWARSRRTQPREYRPSGQTGVAWATRLKPRWRLVHFFPLRTAYHGARTTPGRSGGGRLRNRTEDG